MFGSISGSGTLETRSDATRHFTDIHFDRFDDSPPPDSIMFACLYVCLSVTNLRYTLLKPDLFRQRHPEAKRPKVTNSNNAVMILDPDVPQVARASGPPGAKHSCLLVLPSSE